MCFEDNFKLKSMNILDELRSDLQDLKKTQQQDFKQLKELVRELVEEEKYLSIKEFSDKAGIHFQTTRKGIKDGRISARRFGRRVMIPSTELKDAFTIVKSKNYRRAI